MTGDEAPPGGGDRTIFNPLGGAPPPQTSKPDAPVTLPSQARQIRVGDILNHVYEVKRFIARGGMGEVFEGIDLNTDERVAIKVILQNLAADPNVQAMFRKEARTLARLGHPALVQYRVLQPEPVLGVFYIVTRYVDGPNLSDVLRDLNPTPTELTALTKRLAEGLNAAHDLNAIHRDVSPDNVMLEGGRLDGAKIIDFGIAKDLDPGSATIVGDGFAGKLNYVAPEQLGAFGGDVGPWSDVYSLGLVILAVALKRDVDMGASLADAVDKRRVGPDLSAVPATLRPVIADMLRPDPAVRLRSMAHVVERLAGSNPVPSIGPSPSLPGLRKSARVVVPSDGSGALKRRLPLIAAGGTALALFVGTLLYFASRPPTPTPVPVSRDAVPAPTAVAAPADPAAAARSVLGRGLPSVGCTWLDVASIAPGRVGLTVTLQGVAGRPAEAQGRIARLLSGVGISSASLDFADVSPIEPSECAPLDAFRQIRARSGGAISVAQRQFKMAKLDVGNYKGQNGAKAVINFNFPDRSRNYALFGIEPSGLIDPVERTTADILKHSKTTGPNQHRMTIAINHKGWSGLLLLSSKRPLDAGFVAGPPGSRGGVWAQRFSTSAAAGGWEAEMVWFKTVDDRPN